MTDCFVFSIDFVFTSLKNRRKKTIFQSILYMAVLRQVFSNNQGRVHREGGLEAVPQLNNK